MDGLYKRGCKERKRREGKARIGNIEKDREKRGVSLLRKISDADMHIDRINIGFFEF